MSDSTQIHQFTPAAQPKYGDQVLPYEQLLNENPRWALSEGSNFFEGKSAVDKALLRISKRLNDLRVPYAVAGGMAVFRHGLRRFTEDVDILVTRDGLTAIHHELEGRGYLPPFAGSKNLRDTELGVRIEFLITGGYPGDGKPKPVAFPDPAAVAVELDGIKYIKLSTLIELKLASGISNANRVKDLADVQELIKALALSVELADQLNPYVRDKYLELWKATRRDAQRYVLRWTEKFPATSARSIEEAISALGHHAAELKAMQAAGVTLEFKDSTGKREAWLVATDPDVARKHGMHDESEYIS